MIADIASASCCAVLYLELEWLFRLIIWLFVVPFYQTILLNPDLKPPNHAYHLFIERCYLYRATVFSQFIMHYY